MGTCPISLIHSAVVGLSPLRRNGWGLPAYGGDLNPVAVLISKAMVEIPPRFAGQPPVNPEAQESMQVGSWEWARGLAEDIHYYGQWMRDQAYERIGHLYPEAPVPHVQTHNYSDGRRATGDGRRATGDGYCLDMGPHRAVPRSSMEWGCTTSQIMGATQ